MADQAATLSRDVTIGIKAHTVDEKTLEVLAAADCRRGLVGDVGMPQLESDRFERASTGQDLDGEPARVTRKRLRLSHTEEIRGYGASAATLPDFDAPLRGCGFQRQQVRVITIDAPAGTFDRGETYVASGGKTGVLVEHVLDAGTERFYYVALTGGDLVAADAIIADTSGAMVIVSVGSAAQDGGHLYRPLSESTGVVPPAVTYSQWRGGEVFRGQGRGDVVMRFAEGETGQMQFDYTITPDLTNGIDVIAQAPPAGIALAPNDAPAAQLVQLIFDAGAGKSNYTPPIVSAFELRPGNQVSQRATTTTGANGTTGYATPRIRGRSGTVVFDKEKISEGTVRVIGRLMDGSVIAMDHYYGSVALSSGRVCCKVYAAQINSDDLSDREGVVGHSITLDTRKGPRVDWPYFLAVISQPV